MDTTRTFRIQFANKEKTEDIVALRYDCADGFVMFVGDDYEAIKTFNINIIESIETIK